MWRNARRREQFSKLMQQSRSSTHKLCVFHEASSGALTLSAANIVSFSYGFAAGVSYRFIKKVFNRTARSISCGVSIF